MKSGTLTKPAFIALIQPATTYWKASFVRKYIQPDLNKGLKRPCFYRRGAYLLLWVFIIMTVSKDQAIIVQSLFESYKKIHTRGEIPNVLSEPCVF